MFVPPIFPSPISISPIRAQTQSNNSIAPIVQEKLRKKENRNQALLALAKAIVFFECGDNNLGYTYRTQGLAFKELDPVDCERLNRYKDPNWREKPSEILASPSLLPAPDANSEGMALFSLHTAVYCYETNQFKQGLKACQNGVDCKATNDDVNRLLYIFAFLHCLKDGQIEFAVSQLNCLPPFCQKYPYTNVLQALNQAIIDLRMPFEPIFAANALFLKDQTAGIDKYYEICNAASDPALKYLALNNYFYSQDILIENVIGGTIKPYQIQSIAELLGELNRLSLLEKQNSLLELKERENLLGNQEASFFIALFYNFKGSIEMENNQFTEAFTSFTNALCNLEKGPRYSLTEDLKKMIQNNQSTLSAYENKKKESDVIETTHHFKREFTIFFVEGVLVRVPTLYVIESNQTQKIN